MKTLLWNKYSELTKEPALWDKLFDSLLSNLPSFILGILPTIIATIILKYLDYL